MASARVAAQLQQKTDDGFYGDTASILVDTVNSQDAYGQPVVSTASTSVSCSFTDKPKSEKWVGYADIQELAAELRYNSAPVPAKGNRVILTGQFDGTGYVDKTFEIIGIQDRDAFGYVVALKKVAA